MPAGPAGPAGPAEPVGPPPGAAAPGPRARPQGGRGPHGLRPWSGPCWPCSLATRWGRSAVACEGGAGLHTCPGVTTPHAACRAVPSRAPCRAASCCVPCRVACRVASRAGSHGGVPSRPVRPEPQRLDQRWRPLPAYCQPTAAASRRPAPGYARPGPPHGGTSPTAPTALWLTPVRAAPMLRPSTSRRNPRQDLARLGLPRLGSAWLGSAPPNPSNSGWVPPPPCWRAPHPQPRAPCLTPGTHSLTAALAADPRTPGPSDPRAHETLPGPWGGPVRGRTQPKCGYCTVRDVIGYRKLWCGGGGGQERRAAPLAAPHQRIYDIVDK